MIQVLPAIPKKSSVAERFTSAISSGLENLSQQNQQRQRSAAFQELGIDPRILQLPEEAQAQYFKSIFSPEKTMTPLQEAQQKLAEQKIQNLQSQQQLFQSVIGAKQPTSFQEEISGESKAALQSMPQNELNQLAAFSGQPGEMGIIGEIAKNELEKRKYEEENRTKKESQYFKINEPKVMQLADTSNKLALEELRYNRLEELFKDPSKFPSSFTAALFTKDGHINDLVYSQLTPEAQESIKLIVDSTSNIKDTYGARVTNFDIQTYLKRLPSLLNSTEGKQRVMRDLKIINQLNQMHANGIMEIFDEAGGTDKIPYSTAEKRYKEKYKKQEQALKDLFINPDKETFSDMPNPQKYLGRKIKNPETGEIFISDGINWKPYVSK